jgi:membrane peptidoglycan carboxypeptidase
MKNRIFKWWTLLVLMFTFISSASILKMMNLIYCQNQNDVDERIGYSHIPIKMFDKNNLLGLSIIRD